MEAPSKSWKDSLLEGFKGIEELEAQKQMERKKMIESIYNEQYDLSLSSESELKRLDAETEKLWASTRVNRERWSIERVIPKEKRPAVH
jgi:hypothetical protein